MYIAVTGSSGKLGRPAVAALRKAGHRVVGLDISVPIDPARAIRCDCTDFGQVMSALSGIDITGKVPDAVVHLAGIPMPGLATDYQTFEVNTRFTYNVVSACSADCEEYTVAGFYARTSKSCASFTVGTKSDLER